MTLKHIVIVGGGVAGVELATRLGRSLGRKGRARITLVDRSLSHFWKPMLHTFAAGTARADRQKISFLAQAKVNGFSFHPGRLAAVDRVTRRITLASFGNDLASVQSDASSTLEYDLLVVAVGSRANDFGTPGVVDYCLSIDDLAEAELLHAHLRRHVFSSIQTGDDLHIAIVGGGATGVELAAELRRAVGLIGRYSDGDLGARLRITLIDSGPRLLAAFPVHIAEAAAQTLEEIGVDIRHGARVTGADAQGLSLKEGGRVDANLMVWAAGVRAPDVLNTLDLEQSKTGQLVVKPSLQTTNDPAIFAVGDCAFLRESGAERALPATAQVAHQQAHHLARQLGRHLHDLNAMAPFCYRDEGSLVALANYNGWGTLGRYSFGGGWLHGFTARMAHELLYRQHQFALRGPLRAMIEWTVDRLDRWISPPVELD